MMKSHGLRRIFSFLLAVFMVCALLPTYAFAEDTTEPSSVAEEGKAPADSGDGNKGADVSSQADENGNAPVSGKQADTAIQQESAPVAPSKAEVSAMGISVKIDCTNESHADRESPLTVESITAIGLPTFMDESGKYICTVEVNSSDYVTQFNKVNGNTEHSPSSKSGYINLTYSEEENKWVAPASPYNVITFNVACDNAVPPIAPSKAEVAAMDISVTVSCTKNSANHPDRMSPLTVESIVRIGNVQTNPVSGEYVCTVEVNSSDYVTQFDKTHGYAVHRPTGKSGYINLTYSKEANKWVAPASPYNVITFQVKCVTSPTFNDLKTIFNQNIHVDCTTESTHTEALYDLIENSYDIKDYTTATDNPSCTVIIKPKLYVEQYNTGFGAHATDSEGKSIALYYADDGWTATDGALPVVFEVEHVPDAPSPDTLGNIVKVTCTMKPAHDTVSYPLVYGDFFINKVAGNAKDGYTCTVGAKAAKYINAYINEKGTHTYDGPESKSITLNWNATTKKWDVPEGTAIVFEVACPPDKPTHDQVLEWYGNGIVQITCTDKDASHSVKLYSLLDGAYRISEVNTDANGYFCILTAVAKDYVTKYSDDMQKNHTLVTGESAEKSARLEWNVYTKEWLCVGGDLPISFDVTCQTEIVPTEPTKPTYKELPEISVTLDCGTTTEHKNATWLLLENSYEVGKVELKDDVYTCALTVKAGKYVDEYSGAVMHVGKHELDDDATKDIVLTWKDGKWTAEKSSVTFKVKCKLYTVTYTDGVKSKVIFKDDVHENLAYGSATPKFTGGTPKRTGYTFTGWSPKVTDTVTKDVTYVAQWKSTKNGKDNVPKTGDGETVMILGSVLLFSFCGAATVCVCDRKRKQG